METYDDGVTIERLKRQGYSPRQALEMSATMGSVPKTPQGSNIMPNLAEGTSYALANAALSHVPIINKIPGLGKNMLGMMAGNLGNVAGAEMSGTNYYDKASPTQIIADMGGSVAGGALGSSLATGAAKGLAKRAAGKLAGAAAGRAAGGAAGSIAGPIGTIVGGTLGGWLLPKLFANSEEKEANPDAGVNTSTVAALGGLGLLASPLGRPVRGLVRRAMPGVVSDAKALGKNVSDGASNAFPGTAADFAEARAKFMAPFGGAVTDFKKGYTTTAKKQAATPQEQPRVNPEDFSWAAAKQNFGDMADSFERVGGGVERMAHDNIMRREFAKRKQQPAGVA